MGSGAAQRERDAMKVPAVSTSDAVRVCMRDPRVDRSYCGRKPKAALVQSWHLANCADCSAAARADGKLQ